MGWQPGGQAYGSSAYAAIPQGWRDDSPASGSGQYAQGTQSNQTYAGVPMAYQQGYNQPAGFTQGGNSNQGREDLYAQSFAQQGFTGGSFNAYGHAMSATDPSYAYQAAQMGTMSGEQPK